MGVHYICEMGKYERIFVFSSLFCPVILVPIVPIIGAILAAFVYLDIECNQRIQINDPSYYCVYNIPMYQFLFSFLIILIFCSCQLCICCIYMKFRQPSWRKQQQQQQQQPPNVVGENGAVDERGFLIPQTQSFPPTYSVAIDRDAPIVARIAQTRFN